MHGVYYSVLYTCDKVVDIVAMSTRDIC